MKHNSNISNNLASSSKSKIERVKVSVRIRPFNEEEKRKDSSSPIESVDKKNNTISILKEYDKKTYSYDNVFPSNTEQTEIFEETSKEVVKSVLKGYNGTIFAYGQTGSGKTFTMVGEFENKKLKGIIPRSFDYIFEEIKKDTEHKYNILVSFIQIYLESIQDLLEPSNKEIRIREDPEQGVYLEGVQWVKINNTTEAAQIFHIGEKNRVSASTLMNAHSSRSHAILIAKIEKSFVLSKEKIMELSKESNEKIKKERVMTNSSLYLVDLAGSERVKKTKASNMRLEEAKKINYSLLILGNCIQALSENKQNYICYRDSKLTRLLQESLGGNAKTSLIVTVSPSGYNTDETISSMNFASRAMKVQNKPIINKSVDYQALCIKLQEDLDKLNDEYTELKMQYDKLSNDYEKLKNGETLVELQKKNIQEDIDHSLNEGIKKKNSNKKTNINQEKEKFQVELKKLEEFYQGVVKNKTEEYENVLKDIDKILLEKEKTIEKLLKENKNLNNKIKTNDDILNDYKKEKEDLMNSISDLTNKLNYEKESKEDRSVEQHKKELDKLNSQIELLEKKIIPLENMNSLNTESIGTIQNKIEYKIKALKEEKNMLLKEKSNNVIKISQNDIKIKLCNDEINNIDKKLPTITDEMKNILTNRKNDININIELRQLENQKINELQDDLLNKITNIDDEIKKFKQLKIDMGQIQNDEISKLDKTEIFCLNKYNEMNSVLMNKRFTDNNSRVKKYLDKINQINQRNDELNKFVKKLQKENNDLNKKNTAKSAYEINQDKEKDANLEEKTKLVTQYEKEISDLKNEINNLNKKIINEKKNVVNRNSKMIDDNNKLMEESQQKISKLMQENSDLNKSINLLKMNNNRLNTDLINSRNEINRIKNYNENEISDKVAEYEAQISLLNRELQSKEKIINDSINVNEKMNMKTQGFDDELKKLRTEKNVLNDKINNYETKILQLNNELSSKEKLINDSLNKKMSEYLQTINTKDNEIKKLKDVNLKYQNKLSELTATLKNKENIESQVNILKQQQNKSNNITNETNNQLNILSSNCDDVNKIFIKFQTEVETIQKLINDHKTSNKNIDLTNLNKLIDEENDEMENENTLASSLNSTTYNQKYSITQGKISILSNDKIQKPIINPRSVEDCVNNINEKLKNAKIKFLSLINSYYNSLTIINKKIKEKEKVHNGINDLKNNLLKNILPTLENFTELLMHYQKKLNKSTSDDENIFYINKLIVDAINKLKENSKNQKDEINKLHERVEFFINECAIMKKTGETLAQEQRNNHLMQKEKYEKKIKTQSEALDKMKKKMNEKDINIDEGIRKNNDLVDELLEMKQKYNIQTKDIENIGKKAKEQTNKSAIKDIATAKFAIKEFISTVKQFSDGLYNYTDIKKSD